MPHVAECFSVLRPCFWEHKTTEFLLNPQCFVEVASYVPHPVSIAQRSLKFPEKKNKTRNISICNSITPEQSPSADEDHATWSKDQSSYNKDLVTYYILPMVEQTHDQLNSQLYGSVSVQMDIMAAVIMLNQNIKRQREWGRQAETHRFNGHL